MRVGDEPTEEIASKCQARRRRRRLDREKIENANWKSFHGGEKKTDGGVIIIKNWTKDIWRNRLSHKTFFIPPRQNKLERLSLDYFSVLLLASRDVAYPFCGPICAWVAIKTHKYQTKAGFTQS